MSDYGSDSTIKHPFEKAENPQMYSQTPFAYVSPQPARAILGLYGGNEVSVLRDVKSRIDIESDLRGTTRPITHSPQREHSPLANIGASLLTGKVIERKNPKTTISINIEPVHLPSIQPWAYPAILAPLPIQKETCGAPHKY